MTTETLKTYRSKIHWWLIGIAVPFITWLVVMVYSTDSNIKVLQNEVENRKALMEKIYKTAEESRNFAIQNNGILVDKAEKKDLDKIDIRLTKIECTVDKIYGRKYNNSIGVNSNLVDTTYNNNIPYKSENDLVWNMKQN